MPTPITGHVAVTGTAAQVDPAQTASGCHSFLIRAPLTNTAAVYIGGSNVTTLNGHQFDPGDSFTYERSIQNGRPSYQTRPSDFWVVGTAGDKITWLASA